VAARVGGLAEVVVDGETGLSFPPGDVGTLAAAVEAVLADPAAAAAWARAARERLAADFGWPHVAARTAAVYAATRRRHPAPLGRPAIPVGNLLGPA
jgi:glycogen synthase